MPKSNENNSTAFLENLKDLNNGDFDAELKIKKDIIAPSFLKLSDIHKTEVLGELQIMAHNEQAGVREQAVITLGIIIECLDGIERIDVVFFDILIKLLSDSAPEVREMAIVASGLVYHLFPVEKSPIVYNALLGSTKEYLKLNGTYNPWLAPFYEVKATCDVFKYFSDEHKVKAAQQLLRLLCAGNYRLANTDIVLTNIHKHLAWHIKFAAIKIQSAIEHFPPEQKKEAAKSFFTLFMEDSLDEEEYIATALNILYEHLSKTDKNKFTWKLISLLESDESSKLWTAIKILSMEEGVKKHMPDSVIELRNKNYHKLEKLPHPCNDYKISKIMCFFTNHREPKTTYDGAQKKAYLR